MAASCSGAVSSAHGGGVAVGGLLAAQERVAERVERHRRCGGRGAGEPPGDATADLDSGLAAEREHQHLLGAERLPLDARDDRLDDGGRLAGAWPREHEQWPAPAVEPCSTTARCSSSRTGGAAGSRAAGGIRTYSGMSPSQQTARTGASSTCCRPARSVYGLVDCRSRLPRKTRGDSMSADVAGETLVFLTRLHCATAALRSPCPTRVVVTREPKVPRNLRDPRRVRP